MPLPAIGDWKVALLRLRHRVLHTCDNAFISRTKNCYWTRRLLPMLTLTTAHVLNSIDARMVC